MKIFLQLPLYRVHFKILTVKIEAPRYLEPRADSNQNSIRLDFLNAFTVILPTLTRTLDILNRSNFCFPYRSFLYKFTLDNSNHALSTWEVEKKCTAVKNINIILTTMLSSSVKFNTLSMASTGYLLSIKGNCIHFPSHFLIFGYLLPTPDTSISLDGSSYLESTVCKYQNKPNSRGVIHWDINRDLSSGGYGSPSFERLSSSPDMMSDWRMKQ